jgi:hypothetical protein
VTVLDQIITIVREKPGLTPRQIGDHFPHLGQGSWSSQITQAVAKGVLRYQETPCKPNKASGWRTKYKTVHLGDGKPVVRAPRQKRDAPSLLLLTALRYEIATLKAWQADAIARYPDLGVEPLLLKARQIVAKALREAGEHGAVDAVMNGSRDHSVAIRATITALEHVA